MVVVADRRRGGRWSWSEDRCGGRGRGRGRRCRGGRRAAVGAAAAGLTCVLPLRQHVRHGAAGDQRRQHQQHDADAAIRTTSRESIAPLVRIGRIPRDATCSATVLRTTTPEPTHTPLVHSTCAHPSRRRAVAGPAADLARWRGRGLAARPRRVRRESPGRRHARRSVARRRSQSALDAGRANGLPDGEQQVMCQRLTVASLAALGQLDALGSEAGASVGWLGAAYSVAMRLVTAGRVLPQLTDTGLGWWVARWRPLRADLAGPVAELAATQPPVVARGQPGLHRRGADDGDHRVVRRSDGATAVGRGRLACARHRHPAPDGTGGARRRHGPSARRRGEFRSRRRTRRGARRSGDDLRPGHPPRRGRAGRAGPIAAGAARRAARRLAAVARAGRSR